MTRNQAHTSTLQSVSTSGEERRKGGGAQFWASRAAGSSQTITAENVELEDPTLLYVPPSARRAIAGGPSSPALDADQTSPSHVSRPEGMSGLRNATLANVRITPKRLVAGVAAALVLGFTLAFLDLSPAEKPSARANVARARPAHVAKREARAATTAAAKAPRAAAPALVTTEERPVERAAPTTPATAPEPAERASVKPIEAKTKSFGARSTSEKAPLGSGGTLAKKSVKPAAKGDRHALRPLPASCDPPYYYDRSYIKRIKLECL